MVILSRSFKFLVLGLGSAALLILSGLYLLQGQYTGVELDFYLNREAAPPLVLERRAEGIFFHRNQPFPFHPKGGNFSLKIRTHLIPQEPGEYSLALLSLGRTGLNLGGVKQVQPSLNRIAWPGEWKLSGNPPGDTKLLADRNLQTRWSTGRPKKSGDWLRVGFDRPQRVHGVILDSAPSGWRDCPLRFSVKARKPDGPWSQIAQVEVPGMRAGTVDALFPAKQASALEIKNLEPHRTFYWSVHEMHLITDQLLDSRALKVNLTSEVPLEVVYQPPREEMTGSPGEVERDYGLLLLYWKPPGENWQPVPPGALSSQADLFLPPGIMNGLIGLGRALPWLWAVMIIAWLSLLLEPYLKRPGLQAPESTPGQAKLFYWAGILLLLAVLDDLLNLSGIFRFWSSLLFGPGVEPSFHLRRLWAAGMAVLGLALWALISWRGSWSGRGGGLFPWALAGFLLLQFSLALLWVQGLGLQAPLTSHDHGGFIYSHAVWEQTLAPFIPYNPFWNGGILEWEPIRNGSASAFILARPLTWFLPLEQAYTIFTPLIFVFLLPWIIYLSLRGLGASREGSLWGAFLSLIPHSNWFFWLTMGANGGLLSAGLSLPALAAFWRLAENRGRIWLNALAGAAAFCLALFWMPFVFAAALPCLGLLLLHARDFRRKNALGLLLMILLILGASLPWIMDFFGHFEVLGFTRQALALPQVTWTRVFSGMVFQLGEINPLLLGLGLAGLPLLDKKKRHFLLGYAAYLLILIALASHYLPSYQLNRMQQFLALLWVVPAAFLWTRFRPAPRRWAVLALAGIMVSIVLHAGAAFNFYGLNLERRIPRPAPSSVLALAHWLARPGAGAGRVLLAGRTIKQYGGSAAYLQLIIKKPMVADYPVATLHDNLEVTLPSQLCRRPPPPEKFKRLLALYNITQVVLDRRDPKDPWVSYLAGLDFLKPSVLVDKHFQVYGTTFDSNYLLRGKARLTASWNKIQVVPEQSGPLVLKYCYVPGLKASPPVRLEPVEVWPGVEFIACRNHGGKPFTINYD